MTNLPFTDLSSRDVVVSISPEGAASSMHMDHFSLGFLGKMDVNRATEITFNAHTQAWDIDLFVYDESGQKVDSLILEEARSFDSYDEARQVEVRWLQAARANRVLPQSEHGVELLNAIRHSRFTE